jgi:hypothetical protein
MFISMISNQTEIFLNLYEATHWVDNIYNYNICI